MRNAYPQRCYRCGGIVASGAGHFERTGTGRRGDRWRLQHAACAVRFRGTDTHHITNPPDMRWFAVGQRVAPYDDRHRDSRRPWTLVGYTHHAAAVVVVKGALTTFPVCEMRAI